MNRRSLLSLFASLPFLGVFRSNDGVALTSMSHPIGPEAAADIGTYSLVVLDHTGSVYATAGETVTCENGHPICDFLETVHVGQEQDADRQLGNWRQDKPTVGQFPIPGCAKCGAPFTTGLVYHFRDGWRDPYRTTS